MDMAPFIRTSFSLLKVFVVLIIVGFNIQSAEAKRKITIAGYGGNDVFAMNALINDVVASRFEEMGVEISYIAVESDYPKYILNSLSSGNAPDAFYVNADVALPWINTGKLAPMPHWLVEKKADIHPVLTDLYTKNDKQFAIPKDLNGLALQFNKDVFDDAGVAYPSDSDDWFELKNKLKQVVQNIGDEGVTGLCISADYNRFAPFAMSTGWKPFDADFRTRLDENFRRAFSFYVSLLSDGIATQPSDLGQTWGGGCFAIERAAVTIEGSWIAAYLRDKAPNLIYDTVLVAADPESKENGNLLFTAGWAVNNDSDNKELAFKVIDALTSDKAQIAVLESGLAIPSKLSLDSASYFFQQDPKNKLAKKILSSTSVQNVTPFSFGLYGNQWMEPIQIALSSAMLGELTVDQAIQEAQIKYDEMFAKIGYVQ